MENVCKLSERLSELMVDNGIKSDQLGKKLGVSGQTVRAWCDGVQQISLVNLIKIAEFFNCSIDYLVGRTEKFLDFTPKECPSFYERFREILKEKGISRYRMAKESRIKDSYFTTWQNGSDPHILSLIEVADYLDITIDYLVGRER